MSRELSLRRRVEHKHVAAAKAKPKASQEVHRAEAEEALSQLVAVELGGVALAVEFELSHACGKERSDGRVRTRYLC